MRASLILLLAILVINMPSALSYDLSVSPLKRYFCIHELVVNQSVKLANKKHYYHIANEAPFTIPERANADSYCHDIFNYGDNDNPFYKRLGSVPVGFDLFDKYDLNFIDSDFDGLPDIERTVKNSYEQSTRMNAPEDKIFSKLNFQRSPLSPKVALGYIINPVSAPKNEMTCPNTSSTSSFQRYVANNVLSKIKVEPLYAAKEVPVIDNSSNVLLLSKTELQDVWFYISKDGTLVTPNSQTELANTLYFYWPMNEYSPYIKAPFQKMYRVVSEDTAKLGLNHNIKTPDKSIGCVPHVENFAVEPEGLTIGDSCNSNLDCLSLHCNVYTNRCIDAEFSPMPAGAFCISEASCEKRILRETKVTYLGLDEWYQPVCREISKRYEVYDDCIDSICIPRRSYEMNLPADSECIVPAIHTEE